MHCTVLLFLLFFFFGLAIDFIYQNVFSYVVVRSMN